MRRPGEQRDHTGWRVPGDRSGERVVTPLTRGRDLSAWNGEHDWGSDPVEFAMIRLFEWRQGEKWGEDAQLVRNLVESAMYGKVIGGYHRVDPTRWTPRVEARRMIGMLTASGLLAPGRMRPAVDIERTGVKSADDKVDWPRWTRGFFDAWNELTSCPLRVYAAGSEFGTLLGGVTDWPSWVDGWVGHTTEWSTPRNLAPDDWAGRTQYALNGRAVLHQYAKPPAADTDLNCFMPGKTWRDAVLLTV